MQKKQKEWSYQWSKYKQTGEFLFLDWIFPNKLEHFKGKEILDCGCGSGDHLELVSNYADKCVGIDLNTAGIIKKRFKNKNNVEIIEGDIANIRFNKKFDIVYSIGVLHHTVNPSKSFDNIKRFVKRNGKLILWTYSYEGNFLNRTFLEYLKKIFFLRIQKKDLEFFGKAITAILYLPIYTIYLLPLRFMPFYYYFNNWRKLSFSRNYLNVFDKLNAPITYFIKKSEIEKWFNKKEFKNIYVTNYKGVSWRASGTKI